MFRRTKLLGVLCVAWLAACDPTEAPGPPPPEQIWEPYAGSTEIWLIERDFRSNFLVWEGLPQATRRGPSLGLWFMPLEPHLEEEVIKGFSLERVDDGHNIPLSFDALRGFVDLERRGPEPASDGMSIVPRDQLADGWYVLRVDLSEVLAQGVEDPQILGPRRGNVLHARLHMGSRPMWYSVHVTCGPTSRNAQTRACGYHFFLTEPVPANRLYAAAATIEVRYDGVPVSCGTLPAGIEDGEIAVPVGGCPEPGQHTAVELSMSSELIPDVRGTTQTVVRFVYGGPEFVQTNAAEGGPTLQADFVPHDDLGLEPVQVAP